METSFRADLTNCDREPIHIPGFIQPHGFLIAINPSSRLIEKTSENIADYTGKSPATVLGKPVQDVFDPAIAEVLSVLVNAGLYSNHFETQHPPTVSINNQHFDVILNSYKNNIIIEFELSEKQADRIAIQKIMTTALASIQSSSTSQAILENIALMVKEITGYDRVMVYKFHKDQHGEVMAEAKNEALEPFLHLHYPASDIPAQARELYKINLVRLIADVNSQPSALVGLDAVNAAPLDLTHSGLRAVSPIHIEYLKNMGVAGSFSISLVCKQELWGLIACHHYSPKMVDYQSRMACRFIGQLFSAALEFRTEEDLKEENNRYTAAAQKLQQQMSEDLNITESLTSRTTNLLSVNAATGAALCFENRMYLLGKTPTEQQIKDIIFYLKNRQVPGIFQTAAIGLHFEKAKESAELASGVMVAELSPGLNEYIVWFKPELIQTVDWGGDPRKALVKAEDGTERLSPRKSFEKWTAEIRYNAAEWTDGEIAVASKLREDIRQILNRKSTEIRKLNDLLRIAYEELDTFTYTISHDLRTPLSSIKNYSEIILEDHADALPAEAVTLLKKVVKSTDKMSQLIKDVLHYSKVGRTGIEYKKLDMHKLLADVIEEVEANSTNDKLVVRVVNSLDIHGDNTMITQLFQNLIGNAVKYSAKKESPVVEISSQPHENGLILYTISDNGVGLDMKYANRIFELFRRLDNVKDFEGTGVGLAIVKRIVEKHGGRIWVDSSLGHGTKFYLTIATK